MKGQNFAKPSGTTCHWDCGQLTGRSASTSQRGRFIRSGNGRVHYLCVNGNLLRGPMLMSTKCSGQSTAMLRWPLIAERLGRSLGAVRHKLQTLGYTVESLGGYKVKWLTWSESR